jgi:hypothetical protein
MAWRRCERLYTRRVERVVPRIHSEKNAIRDTYDELLKVRFDRPLKHFGVTLFARYGPKSIADGLALLGRAVHAVNHRIGRGKFELISGPGLGHVDRA